MRSIQFTIFIAVTFTMSISCKGSRVETDSSKLKKLQKLELENFFEVTKSGAFVGVESHGWHVCGTTIPSLIIINPAKKTVHSLTPDNTDC